MAKSPHQDSSCRRKLRKWKALWVLDHLLGKTPLESTLATSPPIWRARQNRTNFVKNFVESVPDEPSVTQ